MYVPEVLSATPSDAQQRPLAESVAADSLTMIKTKLSPELQSSIQVSVATQQFVWVLNDSASASKLVTVLQENGFTNVKVNPEGNTITAGAVASCKNLAGPLGC